MSRERVCTCGECDECKTIMKHEEEQQRDWYERGLSDWRNY